MISGGAAAAGESGAFPELGTLPELGAVQWRPRVSDRSLDRAARLWTLTTVAHTLPFLAGAVALVLVLTLTAPVALAVPLTVPVALLLVAHAWAIPELYAARGASVLRSRAGRSGAAELVALGLLGDLLDDRRRALHARTGLVLERGELGTWLLGDAGAVLVRSRGRRVNCYCVKVTDAALPPSDRTAHLLLALRTDEAGFATVANLAFSGACWRLRRRLPARAREALAAGVADVRSHS